MNLVDLASGTEVIAYDECRRLLASETVGRLGVIIDGRPEIFPVNYGVDGDGILFRSNSGRKVTGALAGAVVFEVDRIDLESRTGWSVVVHGRAEDISHFDSPGLEAQAERSWTGPKDVLVRISLESATGRRVTPASG